MELLNIGNVECIAYCKPIAKFNLINNTWKNVNGENQLKAFSMISYNTNFGVKKYEKEYEYFIIMTGMRPENYSLTGGNTGWGINNFLSSIEKINKNIKVNVFLLDNDAPLEKQAQLVAKYINKIKEEEKCKKVHMLGVSKCGTMTVALLKYLSDFNLEKLNVMAYSAPYLGTVFASPKVLYKKVDEIIGKAESSFITKFIPYIENDQSKKKINKKYSLTESFKRKHWNLFSQSHMDYDISEIGGDGVPNKHKNRYDKKYLENMFENRTLKILEKVRFTNITTVCTNKTLKESIITRNLYGGMLYFSSKFIFNKEPSDGMVSLSSAKYIEKICEREGINIYKKTILNGHHDICSNIRIIDEIVQLLENC